MRLFSRPYGTLFSSRLIPSTEVLGYSHLSLRDICGVDPSTKSSTMGSWSERTSPPAPLNSPMTRGGLDGSGSIPEPANQSSLSEQRPPWSRSAHSIHQKHQRGTHSPMFVFAAKSFTS